MPNYIITQEDLTSMPQKLKKAFLEYLASDVKSKIDNLEDTAELSKNNTPNDEIRKLLSKVSEIGPTRVIESWGKRSEPVKSWFSLRGEYFGSLERSNVKSRKFRRGAKEKLRNSLSEVFQQKSEPKYFTLEAALALLSRLNHRNKDILRAMTTQSVNKLREDIALKVNTSVSSLNGCISSINRAFKYSLAHMLLPEKPTDVLGYDLIVSSSSFTAHRENIFYDIPLHYDSIILALRILEKAPVIRSVKEDIGLLGEDGNISILRSAAIMSARRGECFVHEGVITQLVPSHYINHNGELVPDYQEKSLDGPVKPFHLKEILIGDSLKTGLKSIKPETEETEK